MKIVVVYILNLFKFAIMKKTIILIFLLLSVFFVVQGQNKKTEPNAFKPSIAIYPYLGGSWQSTLFKPIFDFSTIQELSVALYPINAERGTQGFGLDIGSDFLFQYDKSSRIGIRPNLRLRYDYWYGWKVNDPDTFSNYYDHVYTFFCDFTLQVLHSYELRKKKELLLQYGVTINQIGKEKTFDLTYYYFVRDPNYHINFQYTSLNVGIGYDFGVVGKTLFINGSMQANYIPHGHPAYPYRDFMTLAFGLKIRYKPQALVFNLRK